MKIIFTVTVITLTALMLAGCVDDQYSIEKQYWRIQKQAEMIFNNPDVSPDNELERVVGLFNKFCQKYPNNNLSIDAEFSIARLYIAKREYEKARAQIETVMNKYSKSEVICAEALFLAGKSYQIEDRWDSALQQYRKIMQEYPVTPRGLDIPIYLAQYYRFKYQPEKMIAAYEEAISHYRSLTDKYPGSPFDYNVRNLVSQCYVALKDWQGAIRSFNDIIERYNGKAKLDVILMDMALIYGKELKDEAKAKETLDRLIREYPKSRFIKTAKSLLSKGVTVK